jgi:hypothetical protein
MQRTQHCVLGYYRPPLRGCSVTRLRIDLALSDSSPGLRRERIGTMWVIGQSIA